MHPTGECLQKGSEQTSLQEKSLQRITWEGQAKRGGDVCAGWAGRDDPGEGPTRRITAKAGYLTSVLLLCIFNEKDNRKN